jgi:hypothetical protein
MRINVKRGVDYFRSPAEAPREAGSRAQIRLWTSAGRLLV